MDHLAATAAPSRGNAVGSKDSIHLSIYHRRASAGALQSGKTVTHPFASLRIFLCLWFLVAIPRHCCCCCPCPRTSHGPCPCPRPPLPPIAAPSPRPAEEAHPGLAREDQSACGLTLPSTDSQAIAQHLRKQSSKPQHRGRGRTWMQKTNGGYPCYFYSSIPVLVVAPRICGLHASRSEALALARLHIEGGCSILLPPVCGAAIPKARVEERGRRPAKRGLR